MSEQEPADIVQMRDHIKNLETQVQQQSADIEAGQTAQRELAFVRAGIDPADPKMSYFVKGYDGPVEGDAIRSAALEAGFIAPPTGQQQEGQEQDADAIARLNAAAAGGEVKTPVTPTIEQRIQAAQAAGDTTTSLALQLEQMGQTPS